MSDNFRDYAKEFASEVKSEKFRFDLAARFVVIWTLITRIPLPKKLWPEDVPSGDRCLAIAPLAGGLLGLVVGAFVSLVRAFGMSSPSVWLGAAFYALAGWCLHLDGWGDLWDGIGSGRCGEELRAVMKDSRLGAFGAMGLILAFGLWTSLLGAAEESAIIVLIISGAAGRFAMCVAAFFGNYPWESGMGKGWVDGFTGYDLFTAGVCLLLFMPLAPVAWFFSAVCAVLVGVLAARKMNERLGGVSGDVLGAVEVAAELLSLAVFAL